MKKTGRLRDLVGKVGVATFASAIGGAVSAIAELALGGAFG